MKILFLGTGAADWPDERGALKGDFRRKSSVLIDGRILIDPGPCALEAMEEFGADPSRIKYILATHRHSDHFCPETVDTLKKKSAVFLNLCAGEERQAENYTITALRANHSTETVHYIISDGEKRFFYGLDGAWLMYEEIQAIKKDKVDLAVLDATVGFQEGDYRVFEHNNLEMVIQIKASLADSVKRFCISHMARTLHTQHSELCKDMKKHGIDVAFDGMVYQI